MYGAVVSTDARGVWLFDIFLRVILSCVYATGYVAGVEARRFRGVLFLVLYHSAVGVCLVATNVMFYSIKIDWLSVNNGIIRLTLFEKFVRSGWTPIAILAFFLITAIALSRRQLSKPDAP